MSATATRTQALAEAAHRLGRREGRELLQHVCRCSHAELIAGGEAALSPAEATAYSTRHAMEDRLRNSDCPTPISDSITGHGATNVRDEYGRGWTLERKQAELAKACHATIATVAQWV